MSLFLLSSWFLSQEFNNKKSLQRVSSAILSSCLIPMSHFSATCSMNAAAEVQQGRAASCAALAHEQRKAAWGPATCLKKLQEILWISLLVSLKKPKISIFEKFRICMHWRGAALFRVGPFPDAGACCIPDCVIQVTKWWKFPELYVLLVKATCSPLIKNIN